MLGDCCVLLSFYARCRSGKAHGRWHSLTWNLRHWSIATVFFAAVSIVTINLGFGFDGFGTPLSRYALKDPFFKRVQSTPIISNLPLPLPVPYLQGLDLVKFEERMGEAWGNIYMAGKLRVNHHWDGTLRGFPGYYFYAAFFKVPIATQIIFFGGVVRILLKACAAGGAKASPGRDFPSNSDSGLLDLLQLLF